MRGAEAIDKYEAMDQQEAFDIEYWDLKRLSCEECRLKRSSIAKSLWSSARAPGSAGRQLTGWWLKEPTSSVDSMRLRPRLPQRRLLRSMVRV
jgi:hypothetical protein